jgi:hypothetical protein
MLGGFKVNVNWKKRYNKELMHVFGDFDVLSFVRLRRLNWILLSTRMYCKRKVSQVFKNNPGASRRRGRQKNGWWNYVQTVIKYC